MVDHTLKNVRHLLSIFRILSEVVKLLISIVLIFEDRTFAFDITFSHDSHDIIVIG